MTRRFLSSPVFLVPTLHPLAGVSCYFPSRPFETSASTGISQSCQAQPCKAFLIYMTCIYVHRCSHSSKLNSPYTSSFLESMNPPTQNFHRSLPASSLHGSSAQQHPMAINFSIIVIAVIGAIVVALITSYIYRWRRWLAKGGSSWDYVVANQFGLFTSKFAMIHQLMRETLFGFFGIFLFSFLRDLSCCKENTATRGPTHRILRE